MSRAVDYNPGLPQNADTAPSKPVVPRWRVFVLLSLLALMGGAVWLRLALAPSEDRLKAASLEELARRATSDPNDGRTLYYLGLAQEKAGRDTEAFETLARAAERQPDRLDIWEAAARTAGKVNGPRGAINILDAFVKAHPENGRAHLALSRVLAEQKVFKAAYAGARKASELLPQSADAWDHLSQVAAVAEEADDAILAARRAVELQPTAERHAALGNALSLKRRWTEAIPAYEASLKANPDQPLVAASLARVRLSATPDRATAEAVLPLLEKSVAQRPEVAFPALFLGKAYTLLERWKEARTAFATAIRLDPTNNEQYFEMARVCDRLGDRAAAGTARARQADILRFQARRNDLVRAMNTAGSGTPEGLRLRRELARGYRRQGRYAEAAAEYRRLEELNPNDPAVAEERREAEALATPMDQLLAAGARALEAGNYGPAIATYLIALKKDSGDARAWEGEGLALANSGDPGKAIPFLAQATRLDPKRVAAQTALAQASLLQGLLPEARQRMEQVVAAQPENAAAWHLLGTIRRDQGDMARSETALREAVHLDPKQAAFAMDLAEVLQETGKADEAETFGRLALTLRPDDPEIKSRVGGLLVRLPVTPARTADAEKLLTEAVTRQPGDDFAQYGLAKLLLARGRTTEAIRRMEEVTRRRPPAEVKEVWYTLSRAYAGAGQAEKSRRAAATATELERAFQQRTTVRERVALHPENSAYRLAYIDLLEKEGDLRRAYLEAGRGLRRDAGNPALRRRQNELRRKLTQSGKGARLSLLDGFIAANP
ncbi:MAG: tetratricopeptide repeat protein [Capsulimonadales bacterium]|nr:tetratricopeptide repeat protein [Capsulimonadales bacterium]